jgi:exosome complex exonuclease RRP6
MFRSHLLHLNIANSFRPLSQDLFDYARADTHFLLYIYDCMRNELIQNSNLSVPDGDLLQRVLEGSKNYQLQRYEVPLYDAIQGMGQLGWYKILLKTPALFSQEQFSVFKALHQWRDKVAREEDDSIHFVMSNHALMSLSREMPTKKERFMAVASQISASMRNRQDELVKLIAKAKEDGKDGPEMRDTLKVLDEVAAEQRRQKWANERERASVIVPLMTKQPSPIAVVQPTIPAKRPLAVDVGAVRAAKSKFWGSTLGGQTQQRPVSMDVSLALPLPQLTAEIFSDNASFAPGTPLAQTPDSAARPAHAFVPAGSRPKLQEDDVFIIKELGGKGKKRKLEEDADLGGNNDDFGTQQDSLSIEEVSAKEQRTARKAAGDAEKAKKKARKEAKKVLQEEHGYPLKSKREAEEEVAAAEVPFDYANAPSVLHAQDEQQGKKGKKDRKKGKDRGFDPYAKSMDAPKGLPRAQKEKAGRTATFRPQE